MYICQCLQCGETLVDENPGSDSTPYTKEQVDSFGVSKSLIFDNTEQAWVCPNCLTDDFLVDI